MSLRYLSFGYVEDTDGTGSFEAVASTWPERAPAVHAEVVRVLDWAHTRFPGRRGPLDDGFDWDYDLQGLLEYTAPQVLRYDEAARTVTVLADPPGKPRHTVTLSLSGSPEFCDAFKREFVEDDD
ncbi:hypothetical protein [Polaromonas sp. YR568]|uniref:hypothetical protein n=1 Tax=Polaromonas sp. YR568 TaxID=1855301 RepID=UPI00398BDEF7